MASSMASSVLSCNLYPTTSAPHFSHRSLNRTLALTSVHFLSCKSLSSLKKEILPPNLRLKKLKLPRPRLVPVVSASQSNFLRVFQTVWKLGKGGIDAGTNLVPDSVPRPVASILVTAVALTVSLIVIKSFLSTAFFALATMGLVYFIFIALNKDEGPRSGGGTTTTEDSLEEARKIMEKYK